MSMCPDCEGKGFREYDAGLVQIGCKTCELTGKIDCELTKEEFEKAYAFRSDMTPDQVAELGLVAAPSDCLEGWAMQKAEALAAVEEEGSLPLPSTVGERPDGAEEGECIGGFLNDSSSGIGQADSASGSGDTSQPREPEKPKAKKKARKGAR